jgi:hypothetical protein
VLHLPQHPIGPPFGYSMRSRRILRRAHDDAAISSTSRDHEPGRSIAANPNLSPSHATSLQRVGLVPTHVLPIPVSPLPNGTTIRTPRDDAVVTVGVPGELSRASRGRITYQR